MKFPFRSIGALLASASGNVSKILFVAALLVLTSSAFAATPSKASLNGSYVFNVATAQGASWSATKSCKNGANTYTAFADSNSAYTEIVYGTVTFSGTGSASVAFTYENVFDQSASNATIVITCLSGGKFKSTAGQIMYFPSQTGTASGTYTVESNGTAVLEVNVPQKTGGTEKVTMNLDLAGFTPTGVATSALIRLNDNSNGNNPGTGTAIHK
jgi:hypothetical protein